MATEQSISSDFREFEHTGWQTVASPYHDYFSSLTEQAIAPVIDAVQIQPSMTVLDVACGPGYVAAAAQERGAIVTGIDFSSVMIEKAAKLYPSITFVEGDAAKLPFSERAFDAVAMNFGMLHLDAPEQAVAEAFRVLKPGGRFAFSVWDKPDQAVAFELVLRCIDAHGNSKVPLPAGPPFFRFSDADESTKTLQNAGFSDISIRKVKMIWALNEPEDLFKAFYFGTPRTGGLLRAQAENDLDAIRQAIVAEAQKYASDGGVVIPMACVIASATRIN